MNTPKLRFSVVVMIVGMAIVTMILGCEAIEGGSSGKKFTIVHYLGCNESIEYKAHGYVTTFQGEVTFVDTPTGKKVVIVNGAVSITED